MALMCRPSHRSRAGGLPSVCAKVPLLGRMQLVEFCESPWVPAFIRHGITSALGLLLRVLRVYDCVIPDFVGWAAGHGEVLDLGSGSATHIEELNRYLARHPDLTVKMPPVLLSDLHPDLHRFRQVVAGAPWRTRYVAAPLDGTAVPDAHRSKMRCMFTVLHHLRPSQVQALLLDASTHAEGLFVFEPTRRTLGHLLANVIGLPFGVLAGVIHRPRSWKRFLLCTVLPVIPLLLVVDGIASVLRSYSEGELQAMIAGLPPTDFVWNIKRVRGKGPLAALTGLVLMGSRRRSGPAGTSTCDDHDNANLAASTKISEPIGPATASVSM